MGWFEVVLRSRWGPEPNGYDAGVRLERLGYEDERNVEVVARDTVTSPVVPIGMTPVREQPSGELLAELALQNAEFETAAPESILRWAGERFGDRLTMATAFGPEGMVVLHLIWRLKLPVSIFNLETGYQFPQTLALRERIFQRYGIDVELKRPEQSVADYEAANGGPVYSHDPDRCCRERKIDVLRNAIVGKEAWLTAIRRDQSADRAVAAIIGWDARFHIAKINPLANWSRADVWKWITDHDIPYNPLHDQGYTSIGCWPCTRAIAIGEDERAGRWSGTAKTECGLHMRPESDAQA